MSTKIKESTARTVMIPLAKIDPHPANVRDGFDPLETERLAASMDREGLLQDVLCRPHPDEPSERYQCVAGARRLMAAKAAGWKEITCKVRLLGDGEAAIALASENLQRKSLNPIERARSFKLMTTPVDEGGGGLTVQEVAAMLGRSVNGVRHYLSLLRLPPHWQELVARNEVSWNKAMYVVPHSEQPQVLRAIERDMQDHPQLWIGQDKTIARIGEIAERFGVLKRCEQTRRRLEDCTPEAMAGKTARGMKEIGEAFGASATIVRDWKRRGAPIHLGKPGAAKRDCPENDLAAIARWLQANNGQPADDSQSEIPNPKSPTPTRRAPPVKVFQSDDGETSQEVSPSMRPAPQLLTESQAHDLVAPYRASEGDLLLLKNHIDAALASLRAETKAAS